jgi:hypothetical protein
MPVVAVKLLKERLNREADAQLGYFPGTGRK